MKITEVILELVTILKEHGDVGVVTYDAITAEYWPAEGVIPVWDGDSVEVSLL